jgi:hypothetical protein
MLLKNLSTLMYKAYANDDRIREYLIGIVPTYHPENSGADKPGDAAEADSGAERKE